MTDTDHKEIEKIVYNSNNVIRDIVKWIEEDRKRPQDNNPEEGETKNDIAWQQGYAAGKKANNALVPLDKKELRGLIIEVFKFRTGRKDEQLADFITDLIFSKFGKDTSGMVPNWEEIRDILCEIDNGGSENASVLSDYLDLKTNEIFSKFSQQPPKERKGE